MHTYVLDRLPGHLRPGGQIVKALANRSTEDMKIRMLRGSLIPAAIASGLGLVTFSSIVLRGVVRIFNPTGIAVLASCARTTSRRQANISPTMPGLSQPFQIEAPEDKSADRRVQYHRGALLLQTHKNESLLFRYPYFPATTWAWMCTHMGTWLHGLFEALFCRCSEKELRNTAQESPLAPQERPDLRAEALLFISP